MPFIDLVEWSNATNDVFAWKYAQNKNNNLSTFTQLIVRESQEAVILSYTFFGGKMKTNGPY